jgi:large subunit ribosomal protein L3
MSGLLGKKIGMTRIFDEAGNVIPVTVVKVGPCYVTQVKTVQSDGYRAVQLGFDTKKEKNTTKPMMGHLEKAGVPPVRFLKEFLLKEDVEYKLGDIIKVDMFKPGDPIKVTGLSKGRGFAGAMKRHNFSGAQTTHGQSDRTRAPGSLGQSSYPSRVFKGMKMAGRMGNTRVSVKGLVVAKVDAENDLLFIKGAIPGARNSYVEVYKR